MYIYFIYIYILHLYIYIYIYIYILHIYYRKKVFVKDSMSKRTKNVVFIYFASLIIK